MDHELAVRFVEFFKGNPNAVGLEEGGCMRVDPSIYEQMLLDHFTRSDTMPLGAYPMFMHEGEWCVRWSCVDIDWTDAKGHLGSGFSFACRIVNAAEAKHGFFGWIERSRSKGFHVWFFYEEPVPAWAARYWLVQLLESMGVDKIEINPKQTTLEEGQLGNYVRLPMPAWHSAIGKGRQFVSQRELPGLRSETILEAPRASKADAITASIPRGWVPTFSTPVAEAERPAMGQGGKWREQECAQFIVDHTAVIMQGNRDNTIHALSMLMRGMHWPFADAVERMSDICNNQCSPPFPIQDAIAKLKRAYGPEAS